MYVSLFRALLGTAFTFALTAAGAAAVFFARRTSRESGALLGFAAGVMTAASVWSLLLPAIERAEGSALPAWLPAAAGFLLGTLLLYAFDRALCRFLASGSAERRQNLLLLGAVTLHNIPEGMAVGLAFALASDGGALSAAAGLALGIGIQNFPEGAAISLPLHRAGISRPRAFWAGTASGVVEPLFGVLAALFAGISPLLPWLLGFAAGAMLYVVVAELIPLSHERGGTVGFTAGFLIMMILDVALG